MRAIIASLCLLFAWSANAQECTSWSVLLTNLKYEGQIPVSRGMDTRGNLTVMFENPITLDWSIVEVTPRNCARVVQVGTVWSRQSGPQS